jgi:hypothetical protein
MAKIKDWLEHTPLIFIQDRPDLQYTVCFEQQKDGIRCSIYDEAPISASIADYRMVAIDGPAHTFPVLEISATAFEEIRSKLATAGYDHAFHHDGDRLVVDMHGLAVVADGSAPAKAPTEEAWARAPEDQQPADWRESLEHTDDQQILLCRKHDFGVCGKHREDCGADGFPCQFVPWPSATGDSPWCAVCEGRLLPKSRRNQPEQTCGT